MAALLALGCAGSPGPEPTGKVETPTAPTLSPLAGPDKSDPAHNLIKNPTFDDGLILPWTSSFSTPAAGDTSAEKAALCLRVDNKGNDAWDAQLRHRDMAIQKGHTYTIRFKAWSSEATTVRPKLGNSGPPYGEDWAGIIHLTPEPQTFGGTFKMASDDDPAAELTFHMGGNLAQPKKSFTVCIDDVIVSDPEYTPPKIVHPPPPLKVRVNQVGYFPALVKRAMVVNSSSSPLSWQLLSHDGTVVANGETKFRGKDEASGESVHLADFSSFNKPGTKYKLKIGEDASYPFDIGKDIYKKLKYDALTYFYHNRSGLPIAMPYARDAKWVRPAGHTGDKSVPCFPKSGCTYSLDVSGGWYDAGDHGKYVVNGGISVWTLLDQYERTSILGSSSADFGDKKLNIPESGNGVPDILDEARWEIAFMLRMQVPDGNPLAGMVHHKVHDEKWTSLGLAPHDDKTPRYLHAPSTAATLNLAAVAAQAARIWKTFDPAFSATCLAAAEKAWGAAQAHPAVYAQGADNAGGGPYDDIDVSDEFYWAAAELFITTGKDAYKTSLTTSKHFKAMPPLEANTTGEIASMTWQMTQALGTISLAVVPNKLDAATVAAMRASVTGAADTYVKATESQGYRLPMKPDSAGRYPWGSNSFLLNNLVILGLANDFSPKAAYLNSIIEGMDYLLGRNPLAQSYATGYGSNPLLNPHHRFWAHQENDKFPSAPPGAVSGGPNSSLQDPYVQAAGLRNCPAQKCFIDNIQAWSVNEIAINWNAPFAWAVAYLDEKGK